MSKEIDSSSRNLLNFKPVIDFIEPAQQPVSPNPVPAPAPIIDDIVEAEKIRVELFNLAESVDVLATAVQARIDLKAKDMAIALDPNVDRAVLDAIGREFPDAGDQITYSMYKECREHIRAYADAQAAKNAITPEQIADAKKQLPNAIVGGFDTLQAKNGLFRPELMPKAQLIEPLDIDEFQDMLIRILANFLWKNFILKAFGISVAGVSIKKLLPKEIAKIPKKFKKQMKDAKDKGVKVL